MNTIEKRITAIVQKMEARRRLQEAPVDGLSAALFEFDRWCAQNPDEWQAVINSMGGGAFERI